MQLRDLVTGSRSGVCALLGFCVIGLAALSLRPWTQDPDSTGPRTLQEAAALAEERGLFWRSGTNDGSLPACAIVVGTRPVTWERANGIRFHDGPRHPCWQDTAIVYSGWRDFLAGADPTASLVWGELFVYGDRRVIEKLTGQTLPKVAPTPRMSLHLKLKQRDSRG
jgi:hypothetical protein